MLSFELPPGCPANLQEPLARYLRGEISGELALMHCLLRVGDSDKLHAILEQVSARSPRQPELARLVALSATHAEHLVRVGRIVQDGLTEVPVAEDAVLAIRDQFDRAVRMSPEAAVALYSLGSGAILERASAEIVARVREWRLLGPDKVVLDLGCGIGRMEHALAMHVGSIVGIDLSAAMIAEARRRCAGLEHVSFSVTEGRDLGLLGPETFDLVLAIDAFPYLVAAGGELAKTHVREAWRVLRPNGALLILNFSYRGDLETDRDEVERLAAEYGFVLRRAATRDLELWDGVTFLLVKPPARNTALNRVALDRS